MTHRHEVKAGNVRGRVVRDSWGIKGEKMGQL